MMQSQDSTDKFDMENKASKANQVEKRCTKINNEPTTIYRELKS